VTRRHWAENVAINIIGMPATPRDAAIAL